jgi:hypothetical protein
MTTSTGGEVTPEWERGATMAAELTWILLD